MIEKLVNSPGSGSEKINYQLVVAGDGPQADWFVAKLQEIAVGHFKFLGHLTDKEKLAELYANADILIHPNPREPFGIAPLEAMASGTPVVVPNSGGVLSYANVENSWISQPNAEAFSFAVEQILNDSVIRVRKVKNALETVQEFTWEKSFDRCFKLYDDLYKDFLVRKRLPAIENLPINPAVEMSAQKI